MSNIITIPTCIDNISFLRNLLESLAGYKKYPILLVIANYNEEDQPYFSELLAAHQELAIEVKTIAQNTWELGALYVAYKQTDYDNILLLHDSCEIKNVELFDLVFEKHCNRSVAFSILNKGGVSFWNGCIGQYRRVILDKMHLDQYRLPNNKMEAVYAEISFTKIYSQWDKDVAVLFKDWVDCDTFEQKCGRLNMKISNEYLIKWKGHWNMEMVRKQMMARPV